MTAIKFRKKALRSLWYQNPCFSNLAVKKLFLLLKSSTREHTLAKRLSWEMYYTIGRGARNILIKKWKINYFKIKFPFIINFGNNYAICNGQVLSPKKGLQYLKASPYSTEAQWDISDLPIVQNKDYQ